MARARLAMDDIEEMLRLHYGCNLSQRKVARSCGASLGAVNKVLRSAAQAGLEWPLPEGMTGKELQDRVYGPAPGAAPAVRVRRRALEFEAMHRDLHRRRHFTVRLAWEEYSAQHEDAYSYSQFCKLYREWQARHDVTMAQHHKAGEKLFVDYAGSTVTVHAAEGPFEAQIFVATLGASSYFYAEARTWRPGSARTCGRWTTSAAFRRCWGRTTSAAG